jgi:hypothetical protein
MVAVTAVALRRHAAWRRGHSHRATYSVAVAAVVLRDAAATSIALYVVLER